MFILFITYYSQKNYERLFISSWKKEDSIKSKLISRIMNVFVWDSMIYESDQRSYRICVFYYVPIIISN